MDGWMNANVLVLQPGSLYLRVGRATDPAPSRSLHCIGRRRKPGGGIYSDLAKNQDCSWTQKQQQTVDLLYQALRRKQEKVDQEVGEGEDVEQKVRALNISNHVQVVDCLYDPPTLPDCLVGDQLLDQDNSEYNIHFPFSGGDLNIHSGIGGSLTSVLADLSTIWREIISSRLDIKPFQFNNYKVILLIPSIYNRSHVKHLIDLLLVNLHFQAAFPIQEDVAATFGSGSPVSCVVDIGHEKTTVSCVEDAISHPNSRFTLQVGSSLMKEVFLQLSRCQGFPYNPDPSSINDFMLLNKIAETKCCLDIETCQISEHEFSVHNYESSTSTKSVRSFSLASGYEAIVAPMSLFQPELLEFQGPRYLRGMSRTQGEPEDPHDDNYLSDTSRKYNKTGDMQGEEQDFDDLDQLEQGGTDNSEHKPGCELIVPLDQAILKSISSIQSEDLRRRMLVNILLVGGGANTPGLQMYLQNKLNVQVVGGVEVLKDSREGGADSICWRGGAILSAMETAQELWIRQGEWSKLGVRLLRERSLFSWM